MMEIVLQDSWYIVCCRMSMGGFFPEKDQTTPVDLGNCFIFEKPYANHV